MGVEKMEEIEYTKERVLLTIVGESATIEGKFKVSHSLEIDCEVRGTLEIDGKLTIQKNGYVNADVNTVDAEIIGKYDGNMAASGAVIINDTGVLSGSVKTDSLIINRGGIFSGSVVRIDESAKSK
jgi:cytoskeletal protein CcmA (bactofilin family)